MEEFTKELDLLIRSRYPMIYILSYEEARAEEILKNIGRTQKKRVYFWTASRGFTTNNREFDDIVDPFKALLEIHDSKEKAIYVLKDFHHYTEDKLTLRMLRDLARKFRDSYKSIIFLSPVLNIPDELEKDISVMDMPLPDIWDLAQILRDVLRSVRMKQNVRISTDKELIEKVVKAAKGLTAKGAERVFCKAVVDNNDFAEDDLPLVINEKKQIIRKLGLLEYMDFDETMSSVGGLLNLKQWLNLREGAFTNKAKEYGLPAPKGVLLLGVQGCGKSLIAKTVGSFWKMPILRMDVGALFSSYMGKSEENMRRAIKIAESLAPAILWLDEIEKAFAGVSDSFSGDSGTTKRIFGTFLTWMQEKKKPVFIIATANSIKNLPPELLRKGRFDEIFFVDLPKPEERNEIFGVHIKKRKRDPDKFKLDLLSKSTEGFSGAEIEEAIISAMYTAFPQGRDITTEDIIKEADETVPLSETQYEQITKLREWAKNRTRPAS